MVEAAVSTQLLGTFELVPRGGGFLRDQNSNYRVKPNDPFVSEKLARSLGLRGGETILVDKPAPSRPGTAPTLEAKHVLAINAITPADYLNVKHYEDLTAIDPQRRVQFEIKGGSPSMRVVDLMTPIGLGQRGLIVAPPRTGKTMLLQQMAAGVATNHPDVYMMVLLIDERPEEVTEMSRAVRGEVVHSSNDQDIASHVRIARLMIEKAKRFVECGRDVFILLDSLTRLGRAFNAAIRGGGRIMSGGLDIRALTEP